MTIEFVGAIEIDPPMTRAEAEAVRRLGRLDERAPDTAPTPVSPWWPTPDGRQLLLNRASPPEDCGEWLRYLTAEIRSLVPSRLEGLVVGHDSDTGEVATIRAGGGRITRRTLRAPSSERVRSNVIDFAARRRLTG